MAEGNSPQNPPEQLPPTLNYRDGTADRSEVSKPQVIAGIVLSAGLLFATVAIAILTSINNPHSNGVPGYILVGVMILGLNIWAVFDYRRGKRRGFAIGIWIGLGVAALIEGLCFMSMR